MRLLYGLALSAVMVAVGSHDAKAQLAISIGNPYAGQGVMIGSNPLGYGGYAPGYAGLGAVGYGGYAPMGYATSYSSSYGILPRTTVYSSGYTGYAPAVYGAVTPSYYPAYGYGYGRGYGGYRRVVPGYGYGYGSPFLGRPIFRR